MNTHNQINELLVGFALGELSELQRQDVEKHLADCTICRTQLAQIQTLLKATEQIGKLTADDQLHHAAVSDVFKAIARTKQEPALKHKNIWRAIMKNPITKLAAAAVVILVSLVFWQTVVLTSKVYAITDIPRIIEEAKTVHVWIWNFHDGKKIPSEYWFDLENGRFNYYWEGNPFKGPNGTEFITVFQTVSDGRFIMKLDHKKKNAEFQKLLDCQQQFNRLMIKDLAMKMIIDDTQSLNDYTKVGRGEIDGKLFDIWQRQFEEKKSGIGFKREIWVSPTNGEVRRIKRWEKFDSLSKEWVLSTETDKIEKNIDLPTNIFTTVPPDGYTLENSKTTAEIASIGLEPLEYKGGDEIRVPLSFILEDGSILACWCGENRSLIIEPNEVFGQLKFGGVLPLTPIALYGLISFPNMEGKEVGINYVGRHITNSRRADKIYEWALYVPENKIVSNAVTRSNLAILKFNSLDPNLSEQMSTGILNSVILNPETFNTYVHQAFLELSEKEALTDVMGYENILQLAAQIREKRDLYDTYRNEIKQALKHIAIWQPVEIVTPEEAMNQIKKTVKEFFVAIVDGRNDDAIRVLKYEQPRANRIVTGMKELPGIADIKVEDVYVDEETALVISSEFEVFKGKLGRWGISLIRENGAWLIRDFDPTSTEKMWQEVEVFLQHFPNARHFSEK